MNLAYNFFKNNNICLVWSQQDRLVTPPIVTSDFIYLRLIGDRSIDEKDFGTIQKNRTEEMQKWAHEIKKVQKYDKEVVTVSNLVNKSLMGSGGDIIDNFRGIMDMPKISLEERKNVVIPPYSYFGDSQSMKKRKESDKKQKQTSMSYFINK